MEQYEEEQLDLIKNAATEYRTLREEVIKLANEEKKDEAFIKYKEMEASLNNLNEGLANLAVFNEDNAETIYLQNTEEREFSYKLLIGILVGAIF